MINVRSFFVAILSFTILSVSAHTVDYIPSFYNWNECQGSARPYLSPDSFEQWPDSLTPVMINHVGRHGARYAASPAHADRLLKALDKAGRERTLTETGQRLKNLVEDVIEKSNGRWGRLDSVGASEQQGIAERMYRHFPELFRRPVVAVSSYVPRCVMSMYEFTHQLAVCDPSVGISTASGPQFNHLMRFFQDNPSFDAAVSSKPIKTALKDFQRTAVDMAPLRRVLGEQFKFDDDSIELAMAEYSFLAGLSAIGHHVDISGYVTPAEQNSLWQSFNLKQYLYRSATRFSSVTADIARPLLDDLVSSTDRFIETSDSAAVAVRLRFGHAETLMPLLSLMRIAGCYYPSGQLSDVAFGWRDFDIVPMAANLQLILFRSLSGEYYLRIDLNERPVQMIPGHTYLPWSQVRQLFE